MNCPYLRDRIYFLQQTHQMVFLIFAQQWMPEEYNLYYNYYIKPIVEYCCSIWGRGCKENEIIFSVDGIQGVGALPLDVQKCNIDFLSNGGHKWLMGTMGAGFMYIAPVLMQKIVPAFTGWLAVEDAWDFSEYRLELLPDARRFEYATANFMGISALSASVELLLEADPVNIERHLLSLGERLKTGLENLGMHFKGAADKKHWSGIFSFSGKKTEKLYEYLINHNITVSLRNGMIRIAPHFYNSADEIDEVVSTVKKFYK